MEQPALHPADISSIVACCSSLKVLRLDTLHDSFVPALAGLPSLTHLRVYKVCDDVCSAMVQLTGLRQLVVMGIAVCSWVDPRVVFAVGLRQLAALNQLTSLGLGPFSCSQLNSLANHVMKVELPDCWFSIINKAPSGSPPDVSQRLLDMCAVVDACEGLSIEAVIEAAERELEPSGRSGFKLLRSLTAEELLAAAAALKAAGS